jgi:hypothetical protein
MVFLLLDSLLNDLLLLSTDLSYPIDCYFLFHWTMSIINDSGLPLAMLMIHQFLHHQAPSNSKHHLDVHQGFQPQIVPEVS